MTGPSRDQPDPVARRREAADAWADEEPPVRTWRDWLPPLVVGIVLLVGALVVGLVWTAVRPAGSGTTEMGRTGSPTAGGLPVLAGFAHGQPVEFVHSEASDPDVASMLTSMAGSPVLVVPSLADVPDAALAEVYVFRNGIQPDGPRGPLGYQPDVFDSVPGDPTYSPLRRVLLVTWHDPSHARVLSSTAEILAAEAAGELSVEGTAAVVNIPLTKWPGGSR